MGILRVVCSLILVAQCSMLWADGSETLGDASIAIASGNRIVAEGTGMMKGAGMIDLDIPDGALVQVIAYWSGAQLGAVLGDDTVSIGGVDVTGTLIGGPSYFFTCPAGCGDTAGDFYYSSFRADITDLGLVDVGANSVAVSGMDFTAENSGVAILAIVDDGSGPAVTQIKDGMDLAFAGFRAPRDTTVPQSFAFAAESDDRTADLVIFAGSVGSDMRTSTIEVTVAGVTTFYDDVLESSDGNLWDTVELTVDVPAGATEITVQLLSTVEKKGFPASISWIGTGMAMLGTPTNGELGDYIWCDENDDGIQDGSELGIEGVPVSLVCAGDDGDLGTGDDIFASTMSDANGFYLFEGVPAGLCEITVDAFGAPGKELGQCAESIMVDLGPGQSFLDADFCFRNPPAGNDGCSHGYWKNHSDSWEATPYSGDDLVADVFAAADDYAAGAATLDAALRFHGGPGAAGGSRILLRQAVASLLNATHPDVDFAHSGDSVIDQVDEALESGSRSAMLELAGDLDDDNNAGCTLD